MSFQIRETAERLGVENQSPGKTRTGPDRTRLRVLSSTKQITEIIKFMKKKGLDTYNPSTW